MVIFLLSVIGALALPYLVILPSVVFGVQLGMQADHDPLN